MVTRGHGEGRFAVIRGEVWLAALDPTVGSEIQKTRPCLIVSPSEMNNRLHTILAAPLTTGSRPAPTRVAVLFRRRAGLILLDQLRALDRSRLISRLGTVGKDTLAITLARLREIFED
jgi:mRNA interferase MazF